MDDTLDNHCVLCGEEYNSGCFLTANARLWSDEIHDVMPASIVTSFNAFQNFVINSTDEQFKANLENYVYVDSLIDYYIFQYAICGLDAMGKNQLFATYDGTKWIATSYDMDSTFGLYWNGQKYVSATYRMQEDYESCKNGNPNKLYVRLEKLFINEIKARYKQLRADILSYNNIVNTFEPFMDIIGKDLYAEDLTIYTGIPNGSTNNIQQIRNYYRDRLVYVDAQINALQETIPCTNITLNNTTLSFTTTIAQTLTATLTPTNTTDKVVWSVNPTGICTVENGTVTPTSNGQCTITATCGTKSATCNVTVSLPVVAVTALNLDKDSITLGDTTETDTSNINLLDGVNSSIDSTDHNNLVFDSITLDAGVYVFRNINDGTFTYLGARYDDKNYETGNITDEIMFKFDNSIVIQFHAYPDNKSTNTVDKLGLYNLGKLSNPIKFTVAGNGYYNDGELVADDNNSYSTTVTLDSSKKYVLMNDSNKLITTGHCTWRSNNNNSKNSSNTVAHSPINKVFENVSSLSVSINTENNAMTDLTLYEVSASASQKYEDTLIATLTPANATNKNVTWTADNENIQLVANGLNCTVKAKAVGNSVVTCTSQDTTNGTISDTCNVTINAVPTLPSSVLYTLPEETTFNGSSDYVDTGIQLLKTNQDFTITMDVTTGTSKEACLIHCMKEANPYPGIAIQSSGTDYYLSKGNNTKSMSNLMQPSTRTKLVIVKNATTMKVYTSNNFKGESPYQFTALDQTLLLGAYQKVDGTKGRFFRGTIHEFTISNTVYNNEQINTYLGVTVATD